MKSKIALNIAKATAQEVVAKAVTIVNKMTGNPNFPTPTVDLANISSQVAALNQKIGEQQTMYQSYHEKTLEVQAFRDTLVKMIETQAAYVQVVSDNDEVLIAGAGFDVRQRSVPGGKLPATKKILLVEGLNYGEVSATWDPVKGARSYVVEMSTDINNPDAWEYQTTTTKGKVVLSGLESGKRIWIRVAPVNSAGPGAYCDPATKTVP